MLFLHLFSFNRLQMKEAHVHLPGSWHMSRSKTAAEIQATSQ
jgi:hypothetical protein